MKANILLLISVLIFNTGLSQSNPEFFIGIDNFDDQGCDIVTTQDGGFLMSGFSNNPSDVDDSYGLVIKTDGNGVPTWTRKIGTAASTDMITSSFAASDGSFYFVGCTDAFGAGFQDTWVVKMDNTGNILWEKTLGSAGQEYSFDNIIEDGGGGNIVVLADNQVFKISSSGAVLWKKTFSDASFSGITLTNDGGFALSGVETTNTIPLVNANITKLDASGNLVWSKNYLPSTSSISSYFIDENPATGEIYLSGEIEFFADNRIDYAVIKTDNSGNVIWAQRYGQDNEETYEQFDLTLTNDGGVVTVGDSPASIGGNTGTILKISPSGVLEWGSEFGYNQSLYSDDVRSVVQLTDNSYAFIGWGTSFASAQSEESFYFGRPDVNGQTSSGCYYYDRVLETNSMTLSLSSFLPGISNSTQLENSGSTGVTTSISDTLTICASGYCGIYNSNTGTSDGDFIDGVQLSSIVNLNTGSTGGPFYNDYSDQFTVLTQSNSYNIDITSGNWPTGYPDYYAVWIDYNQDEDFDDPGEKLGEFLSTSQFTTQSINFTVPASALTGQTFMRVRGAWSSSGNLDPCTEYNYGETEDYSVFIQTNTGGYCDVSSSTYGTTDGDFIDGVELGSISNLNTGGVSGPTYNDYTSQQTSLTQSNSYTIDITSGNWISGYPDYYAAWIDYNQDGDFSDVGERLGYFLSSAPATSESISFVVPTSASLGVTRMRVRGFYFSNESIDPCFDYAYGETEDYTVDIQSASVSGYCDITSSTYGTSDGDYIDGVELQTISNLNTGGISGPFYNDYTAMQTDILQSGNYDIDITSGTWNSGYADYYAVWIDYNQDEDFDDPGEKVGQFLSSAPNTTESINFTVPPTATVGITRMRVRGIYSSVGLVDPCQEYNFGETEDYSVNILACPLPSAPGAISGANQTCQGATEVYSISSVSGATSYSWSLPSGWTGTSTTNSISTTVGANGGTISVTAINSCGTSSTQTLSISVGSTNDATISSPGTICSSDGLITLSAVDGGGTWSGNGITNSSTGAFDPSVSGVGSHVITYTISGPCGATDSETITVVNSADASILPAGPFCSSDTPLNLSAVDGGGTWSGNGITNTTNGTFDPSVAGAGNHSITYTISGTCGDIDNINITVLNTPTQPSVISGPNSLCKGSTHTFSVTNTPNLSYQWTLPQGWTGNSTSNSIDVTAGSNNGVIEVVATNACGTSLPRTLNVSSLPLPIVTYTESNSIICVDNGVVTLSSGTPSGGSYSGSGVSGNTFNPSIGIGSYDIIYAHTDGNGCSNSDTSTINVESCAGITLDSGKEIDLNVFPNPSDGQFQILLNTPNNIKVDQILIRDSGGRLIKHYPSKSISKGSNELKFELNDVERGVYTISLLIDSKRIVRKIIIQ